MAEPMHILTLLLSLHHGFHRSLNYKVQTDAIKENLILPELTPSIVAHTYASEADMLNVVLFGKTAKEWKTEHPDQEGNIRDYTSIQQMSSLRGGNLTLIP